MDVKAGTVTMVHILHSYYREGGQQVGMLTLKTTRPLLIQSITIPLMTNIGIWKLIRTTQGIEFI